MQIESVKGRNSGEEYTPEEDQIAERNKHLGKLWSFTILATDVLCPACCCIKGIGKEMV